MMVQRCSLKHSVCSLLLTLMVWGTATAQTPVQTIDVPVGIHAIYLERSGDFYIHQEDRKLTHVDPTGKIIASASVEFATIIDPWYGIDVLLYQSPHDYYNLLDTHLEPLDRVAIDPAFAIEPYLVCHSGEKNFWILDRADWSIKRINTARLRVEAEQTLPPAITTDPHLMMMREYQHFLFLLDQQKGIAILNSLGIHIKQLPVSGIEYIGFIGEELYYKVGTTITFYDLFDGTTRTETVDSTVHQILYTDTHIIKSYTNRLEIYAR